MLRSKSFRKPTIGGTTLMKVVLQSIMTLVGMVIDIMLDTVLQVSNQVAVEKVMILMVGLTGKLQTEQLKLSLV